MPRLPRRSLVLSLVLSASRPAFVTSVYIPAMASSSSSRTAEAERRVSTNHAFTGRMCAASRWDEVRAMPRCAHTPCHLPTFGKPLFGSLRCPCPSAITVTTTTSRIRTSDPTARFAVH